MSNYAKGLFGKKGNEDETTCFSYGSNELHLLSVQWKIMPGQIFVLISRLLMWSRFDSF